MAVALTISGSDPSGGAGLQADLKTFHQFGVYGMAAATLLTVQNTQEVAAVEVMPGELVAAQVEAVCRDIPPDAAKTGSLGSAEVIEAVAREARRFKLRLVVDPVMVSKHGTPLLAPEARKTLVKRLLPRALLVTPNHFEAEVLAGVSVADEEGMLEAARILGRLGPEAVLVKAAPLCEGAADLLWWKGQATWLREPRVATSNTHGTGCTFSAAITAGLALGQSLPDAVAAAKRYITRAIATNPGLGHGFGPVNHHAAVE
ncbi:MAG TPA: bifunctional hydroxymethylpyrimidine kinase/phosphomethylpyrimidine kinase [Armatimonadota bacterium]